MNFKAFPNPTTNDLQIVCPLLNSNLDISIKDVVGQSVLFTFTHEKDGLLIQTNILSKGIYFVTLTTIDRTQVIRFIKE